MASIVLLDLQYCVFWGSKRKLVYKMTSKFKEEFNIIGEGIDWARYNKSPDPMTPLNRKSVRSKCTQAESETNTGAKTLEKCEETGKSTIQKTSDEVIEPELERKRSEVKPTTRTANAARIARTMIFQLRRQNAVYAHNNSKAHSAPSLQEAPEIGTTEDRLGLLRHTSDRNTF